MTANESLESGPQSREAWWRLPLRRETRTRNARGSHEERGPGRGTGCCFVMFCVLCCVFVKRKREKNVGWVGFGGGRCTPYEREKGPRVRYRLLGTYVTYKVRRQREPGRRKRRRGEDRKRKEKCPVAAETSTANRTVDASRRQPRDGACRQLCLVHSPLPGYLSIWVLGIHRSIHRGIHRGIHRSMYLGIWVPRYLG